MNRPLLIIAALVVFIVAGSVALGDPPPAAPAPSLTPDELWEPKLDEAQMRVRKAAARHTRALSAWKHARHRRTPRGEPLASLEADLRKAEQELTFAREDLPRLREMARREGVSNGILREAE